MDSRRFDSFAKTLATAKNRRSILKGLFGLGSVAIIGETVVDNDVEAARRPAPQPKPVTCPGRQIMQGGVCTCPVDAPNKCGPDCCTGSSSDPFPRSPSHTECCDNACCDGTCYGEELCCPTNTRPGGLPPTHVVCDTSHGPQCFPGQCCVDSDCDDSCQICNSYTHTCQPRCDQQGEVCCIDVTTGPFCVSGACCPGSSCGSNQICCLDETGQETICCPEGYDCGNDGKCAAPCNAEVQIFFQTHGPLEQPGICPAPFANVSTEIGLYSYIDGVCGNTAIASAWTSENGPAVFDSVFGGSYCARPTDASVAGCLDCPDYGAGVGVGLDIPCSGLFQWTIGVDPCCLDPESCEPTCAAIESPCLLDSDCCSEHCLNNVCVDACTAACAGVDCGSVDGCDCPNTCGQDEECQGNTCVSTCLGLNETGCTYANLCCPGLFCEGGGRCCVPRGGACAVSGDCCTNSVCQPNGTCS